MFQSVSIGGVDTESPEMSICVEFLSLRGSGGGACGSHPLPTGLTCSCCRYFQARGLDLSRVRTCVVVAEERPRIALTQSFSKLFKDLGLHPRAVSTSFGCRVNLAICLQVSFLGAKVRLSQRVTLKTACSPKLLNAVASPAA